jgi:hypothetical protein
VAHLSGISRHNTPLITDGATHELSSHEPLPHKVQANNTEKSDSAKADCDTIEKSQKKFPFLHLPRELRDKIYDYVLTEGKPNEKDKTELDNHLSRLNVSDYSPTQRTSRFPSILLRLSHPGMADYSPAQEPLHYASSVLRVSRQLHNEMIPRISKQLAKNALNRYASSLEHSQPGPSWDVEKQHAICATVMKDVTPENQVRFRILEQYHFRRRSHKKMLPGG